MEKKESVADAKNKEERRIRRNQGVAVTKKKQQPLARHEEHAATSRGKDIEVTCTKILSFSIILLCFFNLIYRWAEKWTDLLGGLKNEVLGPAYWHKQKAQKAGAHVDFSKASEAHALHLTKERKSARLTRAWLNALRLGQDEVLNPYVATPSEPGYRASAFDNAHFVLPKVT